jgi:hypothetical protein
VAGECVAILRWAAGRDPYDRDLSDLVGELATHSEAFRTRWAAHDVRFHNRDAEPDAALLWLRTGEQWRMAQECAGLPHAAEGVDLGDLAIAADDAGRLPPTAMTVCDARDAGARRAREVSNLCVSYVATNGANEAAYDHAMGM